MTKSKHLMRGVCAAAMLAAIGLSGAAAQQLISPASPTPVPGPMPDILKTMCR